jgi:SAM-dependent methyltransferase
VPLRDSQPIEALQEIEAFFDGFAAVEEKWARRGRTYHRLIESLVRFIVPADASVLEIGCGRGDLLAALRPRRGVGIDVSRRMVEVAADRHSGLEFLHAAGETFVVEESFDYVVLSDLVPFAQDRLAVQQNVAQMTHERSRVLIHSYSQLWRPVIRMAELLRLKERKPIRNWVTPEDVVNLLDLAGFETISVTKRVLFPVRIPFVTALLNGVFANVWPFTQLCLTYWIVARPRPHGQPSEHSVSVVVPCRNESGNIAEIVRRVPELGTGTEIVFVEGGSTDDTRAEIERQIELHPERQIALHLQEGSGKADAVRLGFVRARGDILIVLDADLTVSPEDLPKFYEALAAGRAELVNGSRLVYGLEPGAMRFLNLIGNKTFSLLLSSLTGQYVKDTLCGTKALRRVDYEEIAAGLDPLGKSDPFGDFDLLLGAARLGLKIVDLPVRYGARQYGSTNISRFRNGWQLLRITATAFWKLRVVPVRL